MGIVDPLARLTWSHHNASPDGRWHQMSRHRLEGSFGSNGILVVLFGLL